MKRFALNGKVLTIALALATVTGTLLAASEPAQAFHGRHGYYGGGYFGGWYPHRHWYGWRTYYGYRPYYYSYGYRPYYYSYGYRPYYYGKPYYYYDYPYYDGGAIAAGIIGSVGAIIASQARYHGRYCYRAPRRVWVDDLGWRVRRVTVCRY
ncbi:hypothetical protein QNA08_03580 [Chelatococcus sp. SYSU_G07232]|uniref:Lectin-like protein BA14k n=1 Tax=Chelatococcus albus TaxID=3047466 RepID=A0ABT7AD61_9HYPH|nr:hypothetical protein [Chelatococcus sp. SYSU_G07232]MDJ1157318.1 hypothetical protein [Chelatococcus sp. SYSU_G07232]